MNNFAHLREDSPFYPLFERGLVPIRNILIPRVGNMEGDGVRKFYDVDVGKLSNQQIASIAEMVAKQCGGQPAEVEAHMRAEGFIPLRAQHVSGVSSDSLAFL
jgi:hypothetical protein